MTCNLISKISLELTCHTSIYSRILLPWLDFLTFWCKSFAWLNTQYIAYQTQKLDKIHAELQGNNFAIMSENIFFKLIIVVTDLNTSCSGIIVRKGLTISCMPATFRVQDQNTLDLMFQIYGMKQPKKLYFYMDVLGTWWVWKYITVQNKQIFIHLF